MVSKFLDPKNDFAFKRIFGTEKNKDILIHFLNDMVIFENQATIQDVQFLKTVQDPDIASKKQSIVDVLCRDQNNNTYIVEMQVASQKGFEKRAQYYAAKAYINQMNKGDDQYHHLKEVIFLAIVDFIMFPDKEAYKSDHVILDKETYTHDLKGFSFTFLELPKFKEEKHALTTMVDKWAYFFKYAEDTHEKDLLEIFKQDWIIQRAYEELNRFNWSEIELRTYEQWVKHERDAKAILEYKLEQAESMGHQKGLQKGLQRGMEKGKLEEKKQIALNLLSLKTLSVEDISKITGLSEQEIDELNPKK